MWTSVEKRMAMVENVRVALTLVARGEARARDRLRDRRQGRAGVKIVGAFPPGLASRDRLSGRRDRKANAEAPRYIDFLQSGASKSIFEKYGFSFLVKPTS